MRFAIFRRTAPDAEALPQPAGALAITLHDQARLAPEAHAVCVHFTEAGPQVRPGSFVGTSWPFTQLGIADAASRDAVLAWLRGISVDGTEFEVRDSGCAGGLPGVDPSAPPSAPRFAVFVRADAATEAEDTPPPERLAAMASANDAAVRSGLLVAADGLRSTARATRVAMSAGRAAVRDGPFAEAKELIAGFWLVQARSIDVVVDWVRAYPYAQDHAVVEIRPVLD